MMLLLYGSVISLPAGRPMPVLSVLKVHDLWALLLQTFSMLCR